MEHKNYTEVLIDGNVYTLGGSEEELYLQRVAAYISDKIAKLKKQPGFLKQSADYQSVMVQLNLADDYFKAQEQVERMMSQRAEFEKDAYSLKHELITTQMKLDNAVNELEEVREHRQEFVHLKDQSEELQSENQRLKEYLERERKETDRLKDQVDKTKKENGELRAQLEQLRAIQATKTASGSSRSHGRGFSNPTPNANANVTKVLDTILQKEEK